MNTVDNFREDGFKLMIDYVKSINGHDEDSYLIALVELEIMYTNAQIELARDDSAKIEYDILLEIYEHYVSQIERAYSLS